MSSKTQGPERETLTVVAKPEPDLLRWATSPSDRIPVAKHPEESEALVPRLRTLFRGGFA